MHKLRLFALLGIIVILTASSFWPSLQNGFTSWDDEKYVTRNSSIKDLSWQKTKDIFLTLKIDRHHYHPLTMLSFALEYRFFRLNPKIYHLNNLMLHVLNSVLVFVWILLITRHLGKAFLTSILFGLHPMHVESVAWVAERKDVLYAFFYLSSLIFYTRYCLTSRRAKRYFAMSLVLFLCSLLSKPAAMTLPIILILVDYLLRRSWNTRLIWEKIPFLMLSICFGLIAMAQKPTASVEVLQNYSWLERIFFGMYAYMNYFFKALVPWNLSVYYFFPNKINGLYPVSFYVFPVLLILLIVLLIFLRRHRLFLFCMLFYSATILLVIGIIPIGAYLMADRYSYIPFIGLFLAFAHVFFSAIENQGRIYKNIKHISIGLCSAIILIFSYMTYQRCQIWGDDEALWGSVIQVYENQAEHYKDMELVYNKRGLAYYKKGNYAGAVEDFSLAIKLKPTHKVYNNRAANYRELGKYDLAILDYSQAIRGNPSFPIYYKNRGKTYFLSKQYDLALSDFNKSLSLRPEYYPSFYHRAIVYQAMGQNQLAFQDLNKALKLNPRLGQAYEQRSRILYKEKYYRIALADILTAQSLGQKIDGSYLDELRLFARDKK